MYAHLFEMMRCLMMPEAAAAVDASFATRAIRTYLKMCLARHCRVLDSSPVLIYSM